MAIGRPPADCRPGFDWREAAHRIVDTFRQQQRKQNRGPYHFQRSAVPTDTVPLSGYGIPARPIGLIYSMFRPSDDSCVYPLFIPANLCRRRLRQLAEMAGVVHDAALANEAPALAHEVETALAQHGHARTVKVTYCGPMRSTASAPLLMDDANAPSLLWLPYLGCCAIAIPLSAHTRLGARATTIRIFSGKAGEASAARTWARATSGRSPSSCAPSPAPATGDRACLRHCAMPPPAPVSSTRACGWTTRSSPGPGSPGLTASSANSSCTYRRPPPFSAALSSKSLGSPRLRLHAGYSCSIGAKRPSLFRRPTR